MKIKHVRESDFQEVEHEYPDFQIQLAEDIAEFVKSKLPVITSDCGKKVYILTQDESLNLTRSEKEFGLGKYRITIEPLI